MSALPITSTVAALLAALMLPLTIMISMRRVHLGKAAGDVALYVFGDGDDETLRRRIRALGNFVEYVPMALLMLALIEAQGASTTMLWSLGGAFAAGRVLHAFGMLAMPRKPAPRIVGMMTTYAALLLPAVWIVSQLVN